MAWRQLDQPAPILERMASVPGACCKRCGAKRRDGVKISTRGLCVDCSQRACQEAQISMATKTGQLYKKWKRKGGDKGAGHPKSTRWESA